jgi:uncharacterized membrane protein YebE (DUF533 family)
VNNITEDFKTPYDDDVKIEISKEEEESLEIYSKNQDAIVSLLRREKKYKFLAELASTYGELANEVNNRIELTKMMDPGAIAIAVQLLQSSFELIEKAAFKVKEDEEPEEKMW